MFKEQPCEQASCKSQQLQRRGWRREKKVTLSEMLAWRSATWRERELQRNTKELNVPKKSMLRFCSASETEKKKKKMLPYLKVDGPRQVSRLLSVRELGTSGKEFWEHTVQHLIKGMNIPSICLAWCKVSPPSQGCPAFQRVFLANDWPAHNAEPPPRSKSLFF